MVRLHALLNTLFLTVLLEGRKPWTVGPVHSVYGVYSDLHWPD